MSYWCKNRQKDKWNKQARASLTTYGNLAFNDLIYIIEIFH